MRRIRMPAGTISRRGLGLLGAGAAGAALLGRLDLIRPAYAAETIVKIGQTEALTGPSAAYGIRGRDGAALAVDDINAAGGVPDGKGGTFKLEISCQDMANDPKQAVTIFRQYAADPTILAAVGPTNSVGFIPMVPIAAQVGLPLIADGSTAPIKEWNPWACRPTPIANTAIPALMRKVVAKGKLKRVAVLYDQTQDGQAGDAMMCRQIAKDLGYEIVAFEAFRANDQDFSPQLATISNAKPDGIFLAAATGDGIRAFSQIREMGLEQPVITGSGSFADPVYWDGTKGGIKGCFTWLAQDFQAPTAQLQGFLERYTKRFPQAPTSSSTGGYDAVCIIAEILRKSGVADRATLQKGIANIDMTTPLGTEVKIVNPPSGDNLSPSVVAVEVTGRGTYTAL